MLKLQKTTLLLISLFAFYYGYAKEQKITISGEINKKIHANEITFVYWDELISETLLSFTPEHKIKVPIKNGRFNFEMQTNQPWVYLSFAWNYGRSGAPNYSHTYLYIAEAGDNVFVKIDSVEGVYSINFDGHGAEKYTSISSIKKNTPLLKASWSKENRGKYNPNNFREFKIERSDDFAEQILQGQLRDLEKFGRSISAEIYQQYQINLFASQYMWYCSSLLKSLLGSKKTASYQEVSEAVNYALLSIQKKTRDFEKDLAPMTLAKSPQYIDLKWIAAMINSELHGVPTEQVLAASEQPEIRDKCLADYIINSSANLDAYRKDSLVRFADSIIRNPLCRGMIKNFTDGTKIGRIVSDFSLPDINSKMVKLSDFRGKVVFVDFWFVGCGACANYYQTVLKEIEQQYHGNGDVVFITISVDKDRKRWIDGIESGKYTSREAINLLCSEGPTAPIIQQLGVKSFPKPLLIDREGKIFSNSENELRYKGIDGLKRMIEEARNQ